MRRTHPASPLVVALLFATAACSPSSPTALDERSPSADTALETSITAPDVRDEVSLLDTAADTLDPLDVASFDADALEAAAEADAPVVDVRTFGDALTASDAGEGGADAAPSEPMPDFMLVDQNPNSPTHRMSVSPRQRLGAISAWYFATAT